MSEPKLLPFATKTLPADPKLHQLIDFLNKSLKEENIMFGISQNTKQKTMTISIYRV